MSNRFDHQTECGHAAVGVENMPDSRLQPFRQSFFNAATDSNPWRVNDSRKIRQEPLPIHR